MSGVTPRMTRLVPPRVVDGLVDQSVLDRVDELALKVCVCGGLYLESSPSRSDVLVCNQEACKRTCHLDALACDDDTERLRQMVARDLTAEGQRRVRRMGRSELLAWHGHIARPKKC